MKHPLEKPLYALTIGEFIDLMKETIASLAPPMQETKPFDQEEYFTIEQLRHFLNCSKVTVHNYKKRSLSYFRLGRKLLFKKSEVLNFMQQNVRRFYGENQKK